jgi:DNA-binding XRE family transcriptional regulator
MTLEAVGDVTLGVDQQVARETKDAFIGSTTGCGRQFGDGSIGDVDTDDGEIAVIELPNVRATPAADSLGSVSVRVRADAFDEIHRLPLTMVRCFVKPISAYFPNVASNKSQQAICSRVARILRQEREKHGLSMNLVAERAGLSQQMVSYVEREMRNPTLETLLRIAAAMKIDLAKVLQTAQKAASKSK